MLRIRQTPGDVYNSKCYFRLLMHFVRGEQSESSIQGKEGAKKKTTDGEESVEDEDEEEDTQELSQK